MASLANYNLWLNHQARKTNINADTLLRVSWLGCTPDNSSTHLQVTAAAVQAVQDSALEGLTSLIGAYTYDLHVLDAVQDSQQVALWPWKTGIKLSRQIQPCVWSFLGSRMEPWGDNSPNISCMKRCPIQESQTQGIRGDPLSAGFASCAQRGHSKGMP